MAIFIAVTQSKHITLKSVSTLDRDESRTGYPTDHMQEIKVIKADKEEETEAPRERTEIDDKADKRNQTASIKSWIQERGENRDREETDGRIQLQNWKNITKKDTPVNEG